MQWNKGKPFDRKDAWRPKCVVIFVRLLFDCGKKFTISSSSSSSSFNVGGMTRPNNPTGRLKSDEDTKRYQKDDDDQLPAI